MNIISKDKLVDGGYYEGQLDDGGKYAVARWNAQKNLFRFMMYSWDDEFLVPATYYTEINEYYYQFKPTLEVSVREFEKVKDR